MPQIGQSKNKGVFRRPCYQCGDKAVSYECWNKELSCCDTCAKKVYLRSLEECGYDEYFKKGFNNDDDEDYDKQRQKEWYSLWYRNNKGKKSSGETFRELIERYKQSFKQMKKRSLHV